MESVSVSVLDTKEKVLQALLFLHSRQTMDEQMAQFTTQQNGQGFNKVDAPILSSIAQQVLSEKPVSDKQLFWVGKLIQKYQGQFCTATWTVKVPEAALREMKREERKAPSDSQGIFKVIGEVLQFYPKIYPTNQIKQLGFRWNKALVCWEGELTQDKVRRAQDMFPKVEFDQTVQDYLSSLERYDTLTVAPKNHDIKDYQLEATAFMTTRKRALLALAPGTGKSLCGLMAALERKTAHTLIICPLSLVRNWQNEIRKWSYEHSDVWHKMVGKAPKKWTITNYDTVVRNLEDFKNLEFDTILVDESVLIKNRKTKRFEAISNLVKKPGQNLWLLSGSPTTKYLDDMWAQLYCIDPRRVPSYWKFAAHYCILERNQWGTRVIGNRPEGISMLKRDFSDIYFSRTQDEVLDLPDWIFEDIEAEMSDQQYKIYAQMENEFLADFPDGDSVLAPNILSQMIRLIQFASNPLLVGGPNISSKWDALKDMMDYITFPVIVWTNFISTANHVKLTLEKAKIKVGVLTGETPTMQRQSIVDGFQEGKTDVIVAHPGVGKYGFTLTKARTAVYLERSYDRDAYYQSLHRVRRIGTTLSPHIIHLLSARPNSSENTIDHVINYILKASRDGAIQLTSGLVRKAYQEKGA
jgi:SNF2 family DNA or RNA helicase